VIPLTLLSLSKYEKTKQKADCRDAVWFGLFCASAEAVQHGELCLEVVLVMYIPA